MDLIVMTLMTVVLIVGVYQFYFWTQNNMIAEPRGLAITLDEQIRFRPRWVWIYSGLYYPMIVLIVASVRDMRHFNLTAVSFFVLLFAQMAFFRYFPVATPPRWRALPARRGRSLRFLRYVQGIDKASNCFPSMHVSVAMLTGLHLMANWPATGMWPLLFPALIALSAVYTKQHFIADLVPGALLGGAVFGMYTLALS